MKMKSLYMAIPLLMTVGCSDDNTIGSQYINAEVLNPAIQLTIGSNLSLSTDRVNYRPGQEVIFTAEGTLPTNAKVRYRHGFDIVGEQDLTANTWTWTPTATDYQGYMAEVYTQEGSNAETIHATIAVDVSSDWAKFPRYGFVSDYDASKTEDVIKSEMAYLNRCHINGIQYYDWLYKHHQPLGGTPDNLLAEYKDLANRPVLTSVIKGYIKEQKRLGMKTMFYNLCFGTLDDAQQDGVDEKWGIYTDQNHRNQDKHDLPSSWKSDIYLVNPGNKEWQEYLIKRNADVYTSFDFDGFHIDQLGSRSNTYDYYGGKVNLPEGYASFINAMKEANQDKRLVMNAVSSYGQSNIAGTGKTEFLYNEVWGNEARFTDLHDIIRNNAVYSRGQKATVFAAYMNYESKSSTFNEPGILLTDAVMFALGGSHLELGSHMLCSEYFPNTSLQMSESLKQAIIRYYDFLTAYQNLLRDGGTEVVADIVSGRPEVTLATWPPKMGVVTTYAKNVGNKQVVHLLNFKDANSLSWRDLDGSMPEPNEIKNLTLRAKAGNVKRVWVATPDSLAGAVQQLTFRQEGDYAVFTVPTLKYWTMIVIE